MDFENIYNKYFNDVYKYILKLSRDEHIAEEITSETFFKAMRSIKTFRGECDIRVWLCQIAKNTYFSYLKKHKRIVHVNDEIINNMPHSHKQVDEIIEQRETMNRAQKALHILPEPYKEVFMWRAYAELTFKEIGDLFNKSDNWACVTYHRARQIIKNRLEEHINDK